MQHTNEITFYHADGSNCSERVLWVLLLKKLRFQLVNTETLYGTPNYSRINPFGRVPSLTIDGTTITESMVMVELLEELCPNPALLHGPFIQKAKIREVCEIVNATIHPVQNSKVVRFFLPEQTKKSMKPIRAEWITTQLKTLKKYLWQQSHFAVGNQFSLADIFTYLIFRKLKTKTTNTCCPDYLAYQHFIETQPQHQVLCQFQTEQATSNT